jgi:hypothetical protein
MQGWTEEGRKGQLVFVMKYRLLLVLVWKLESDRWLVQVGYSPNWA